MRILVILGHPHKDSFNHAIAHTSVNFLKKSGHEVIFHDLYQEGFDPILPYYELEKDAELDTAISTHCDHLKTADGIIVIHPNWWGQPPALMKGWIERVFRPGVAYKFLEHDSGEGVPVGLLHARQAIVFNTSNTMPEREMHIFGDPLETIWKNCIFGLCGVNNVYRRTIGVIVTSTDQQRKKWLKEVEATLATYFPAP